MNPIDENLAPLSSTLNELRLSKDDGKKISSRIAQVFGDSVLAEDISLTYSPSPMVPKKRLANITNVESIDPSKKTLPFGLITFTPNKPDDSTLHQDTSDTEHRKPDYSQDASQTIAENKSKNVKVPLVKVTKVPGNAKSVKKVTFKKTVQRKTDSNNVQKVIDMATTSVNQTLNFSRMAKIEDVKFKSSVAAKIREEKMEEKQSAASLQADTEQAKRKILDLRSKLFSEYTKQKTHRYRKEYHRHLEKVSKDMEFNSKVYVDHKITLKEMADARRRKSVHIKSLIRNEQKKWEGRRKQELQQEEHDSFQLKWAGEEDAKRYLEQQTEERRKSFAFRNQEGRRHRELEEQWRVEELQRAHENEVLTAEAHKDEETYTQLCEEARRESFAFRNREGVRHRAVMEELKQIVQEKEHESYMLKWAGEEDAKKYLQQQAEERRKSLADRNQEGRRRRELEEQWRVEELQRAHHDEVLMAAAHKDEEKYKERCEQARRESFVFRNQEGTRQRAVMQEIRDVDKHSEHESYMLKWAGDEDAKKYLEQQAGARRKSLALRNQEGQRHRELEERWRVEAIQQAHEDEVLRSADHKALIESLEKEAEERRLSLNIRSQEARHHREIEEQWRVEELQRAHEDEMFKAADQKELEEYRSRCAARDRASLAYRRKEAHIQRLQETHATELQMEEQTAVKQLEDSARLDVLEYVEECKMRRRLSLAYRANEKRRHREWERQKMEEEREQIHCNTKLASLDRKYEELAKQKERACIALDALRHAGCSFNVNPFAALLEDL